MSEEELVRRIKECAHDPMRGTGAVQKFPKLAGRNPLPEPATRPAVEIAESRLRGIASSALGQVMARGRKWRIWSCSWIVWCEQRATFPVQSDLSVDPGRLFPVDS
jgi:hypothetical protein